MNLSIPYFFDGENEINNITPSGGNIVALATNVGYSIICTELEKGRSKN